MNVRPKRVPRLHCALQGLLPMLPDEIDRPKPAPEPPAAPRPTRIPRGQLLLVVLGGLPIGVCLLFTAFFWSGWGPREEPTRLALTIGRNLVEVGWMFFTQGWLLCALPLALAFGLRLLMRRLWPVMVVGLALVFSLEVAQWVPLLTEERPDWVWSAMFGLPWAMTGMFLAEAICHWLRRR